MNMTATCNDFSRIKLKFDGEQAKILEVASDKTHISPAKGQNIDQLAQQNAKDRLADGVSEQYEAISLESSDFPIIRSSDRPLTNKAQLLLIMGQYQAITNSMDDAQRTNMLAIFLSQLEAKGLKALELSRHLDSLHTEYDGLLNDCTDALNIASDAFSKVTTAERQLADAESALTELLQLLGVANADDPAVKDKSEVLAAKNAIADAKGALSQAQTNLNSAKGTAEQALGVAQKALNEINTKTAEMNTRYHNIDLNAKGNSAASSAVAQSEKGLTKTATMILLITEFVMKMEEAASDKLLSDLELNRIQAKARQAEMQRKSDEYMEQMKKAEETQKMANCIGKILGGIAITLGAITTIFGGSGIALMAVGVGLMVADPIVAALTGKSLTERIMDPIMQHVFMPLMNIIGDIVTKIFDFGPLGLLLNAIDKATGANMMDTVHMAVTAVVTISAIVAIAFVAVSAVKIMIDKMANAMTSAIMRSIKEAITQVIKKMTDPVMTQKLGKQALNRLTMTGIGVQVSTTIIQAGMNINVANLRLQATKTIAEFDMASMDVSILRELISTILEQHKQDQKLSQMISVSLSNTLKDSANANRFIIRNIHA
ncbi:type III secretion system translocon subunit SctE [Yersinia kristensenii]|uniref:type III secretion system translocon subunit SctE n=1 Tax=Yersinia kristensenii TaxID=28152 RepID=UPI0005E73BBC|nr:type III secretion system translocon subunit SctE [Yersinia kristensenii]CNF38068.1 Effector protein sipB [Yersinia kristensenii]